MLDNAATVAKAKEIHISILMKCKRAKLAFH